MLIDVLGPEQQFSWVRTGNLYVLSATDHSEADLRELVAFVMEWYQRKR